jgi:UDP:flavonoid glycosyltransferase YjiC (YdhE family)
MKILFACAPGVGHLLPLLPLARASRSGGHEVVVACGASLSSTIQSAGLQHAVMGPTSIGSVAGTIPGREGLTGRQLAMKFVQHVFCGPVAAGMAEGVGDLVTRWRPDIIVHEDLEFGSGIAAERAGIPHATLQVTAWRPHVREMASVWLDDLRARQGLSPDPEFRGGVGRAFFATRPAALRDPTVPYPAITEDLRPIADDRRPNDEVSEPFERADDRPRVAITLGTVNGGQLAVLRSLIEGAAAAGAQVVVALGADPATLFEVPPGVTVLPYVPMSALVVACDVIAYHGGSGTMLAAAAAGKPMLIVPLAADQPENADLCQAAGIARVIALDALAPDQVRTGLLAVLADPSYRLRAGAVAAEIAAMPGPETALHRLENIVALANSDL